jgi:hypothetical protein
VENKVVEGKSDEEEFVELVAAVVAVENMELNV